jgi:quercetin dioxygenase-like cupin family protein
MELPKQPQTGKGPAEMFAGGDLIEAHPGDIIYTPPGEEHVTDAEYNGPRVSTRR